MNDVRRWLILNCSRQSGKSSMLMVKATQAALVDSKSLVLVVAEQRQSNEDLRKARELVKALDKWLDEQTDGKNTVTLVTDAKTTLEFANGSRIIALPANEKVRGFSAPRLVVIDEAAYLDDEVFVGIDPMLEVSQGQLVLASTPHGTTGFFHQEWSNPRYYQYKVPWQECPRISAESIANKRLLYGEAYVKQEYEAEFLDDLSSLFTARSLQASLDENEDVFGDLMQNINKQVTGEVELI